jgi:putative acetyltransferase
MYTFYTPLKTDHQTLLSIWESSVKATHLFLKEDDIEFFKTIIQQHQVFDQVSLTALKDEQDMIVGFMGVANDSLEMIFLDPDATGKGLGKMLLQHAIDNLKITRVDVNEQNETALQFYKHFGFKVMSRSELDGTGKPYPILHMQLVQ